MIIEWKEAMSVGVPELDADHKGLIDIINRLADQSDRAYVTDAVESSLVALMRYAEVHFAREERVMSVCGYASDSHHLDEHRNFVTKVQKISQRFENDPKRLARNVNEELGQFLSDWLKDHILNTDMAYKSYVTTDLQNARKAAQSVKGSHIWWTR